MATNTWVPIATYDAPSTQSTITFNSIPQTYKNLVLRGTVQVTNGGASYLTVRYNNNTGSVYDSLQFYSSDPVACYTANNQSNFEIVGNQFQTFRPFQFDLNLNSYSVTNKYKTTFLNCRPGDNTSRYMIGTFKDTSNPVSRIDIISSAASMATGTTFTLWGLA